MLLGTCATMLSAQVGFGFQAQNNAPLGSFGNTIKKNFSGVHLNSFVQLEKIPQVQLSGYLGAGMYAYKEYDLTHTNKSGNTVTTPVYEDDCMLQIGLNGNYIFSTKTAISPVAGVGLGFSKFFSHIDPMSGNTQDMESRVVWHGTALNTTANFGFRFNISRLIKKDNPADRGVFLNITKSFTHGSKARYRYFEADPEQLLGQLDKGIIKGTSSYNSNTFGLSFLF